MDANLAKIRHMSVKRTLKALEDRHFDVAYVEDRNEALKLVRSLIPTGCTTSTGGSVTLLQCGIMDYLKEETAYIDWRAPGLAEDESRRLMGQAYAADYFLCSANALTEHGEVYQVDGQSNRISFLAHGPRKVIMVVGINKIVPHLRAAVERVKRVAAPANTVRLCRGTWCQKKGKCVSPSFDEDDLMCHADCGDETICCNTLVMRTQRTRGRVTLIIVGEELGY